jgi:hypothetical protein
MTDQPTTYTIERMCLVDVRDPVLVDTWAWLPVGEIVAEPDAEHFYNRDALVAWAGEQDGEPPVGRYRVIEQRGGYPWHNFEEFEVREHRETIIERYDRPVPAAVRDGVPANTAAAIEVIADAAAAPGVE